MLHRFMGGWVGGLASVLAVVLAPGMKTEPNQAHPNPSAPFRSLLFILRRKSTKGCRPKTIDNSELFIRKKAPDFPGACRQGRADTSVAAVGRRGEEDG